MKIKINGKQATVEMPVEHLMGILELAAQRSCGYGEVASDYGTYFFHCCDYNEIAESIATAIDTSKLGDEQEARFVDEIKKEMKRNGRY